MKVFSVIGVFAGMVIMGSLTAAHFMGEFTAAERMWLWLIFFVGANLFQMGFTGFCPATRAIYAMGIKDKQSGCKL